MVLVKAIFFLLKGDHIYTCVCYICLYAKVCARTCTTIWGGGLGGGGVRSNFPFPQRIGTMGVT